MPDPGFHFAGKDDLACGDFSFAGKGDFIAGPGRSTAHHDDRGRLDAAQVDLGGVIHIEGGGPKLRGNADTVTIIAAP